MSDQIFIVSGSGIAEISDTHLYMPMNDEEVMHFGCKGVKNPAWAIDLRTEDNDEAETS